MKTLSYYALLLLFIIQSILVLQTQAHGDDEMPKKTSMPIKTKEHDDGGKMSGMGDDDHAGGELSEEERRMKRKVLLVFHAVLASFIVFVSMPVSIALVSGKKIELHRIVSSANTLGLCFVGFLAVFGFADGESWHAKIAFLCLGAWVAQSSYGWVRHFFFKSTMPIKPHRFVGIVLFVLTLITWTSGVLHVMGSCNAPNDVQMCNAHFYLGALFVIVGVVNGYYQPEFSAKVEMCLITLGGFSELLGEGVVDSILNAIDPVVFRWDSMAKMVHLSTAAVWIICAFVGWALAVRRPSTLQRGVGLTLGALFHLLFMFSHGAEASPRTQAAHLLHELCLIPVLFARPTARLPKVTSYLLTVSGFAFIFAADPITRDAGEIPPVAYVVLIVVCASIFHAVHAVIRSRILKKGEPTETMLERTGWAQPVYCFIGGLGRVCCCCPSLTSQQGGGLTAAGGSKYQHLDTKGMEEETKLQEMDEDVTSAPPI